LKNGKKNMNKRQWGLILIAGALAAVFGMGLSSYKYRVEKASDTAIEELLTRELRSPDGTIHQTSDWRGKILVINYWASWCPPCVEEMPELVRSQTKYASKNVLFVGIGVDSPSNIREFLVKTPVNYPIVLGGLDGATWAKKMGNPSSALPFTLMVDRKGAIVKTKLGKISEDELSSWIDNAIIASQ
jgi:thiol-disulfide isomerase/thioredoxin